jgi:hypothetical protein
MNLESNPEFAAPASSAAADEAERMRKQAAYRDYLTSQGLTPLGEVLQTLDTPAPAP